MNTKELIKSGHSFNAWGASLRQINERDFIVTEEIDFETDRFSLSVPKHFITDLGSTPWYITPLFPRYGKYTKSAIIHDWLYSTQYTTRKEADWIFIEAMRAFRPPPSYATRCVFYSAVRTGGWNYWRKHTDKSIATQRSLGGYFQWKS